MVKKWETEIASVKALQKHPGNWYYDVFSQLLGKVKGAYLNCVRKEEKLMCLCLALALQNNL